MNTRITTNIEEIATCLQSGGIAAIPTETVYGLAGNALDANSVVKIFEAKRRPSFDPLIVHIAKDFRCFNSIVESVSPNAKRLIDAFWPGPLTVIFEKTDLIPDIVTSGLSTVGVRMPSHPMTQELLMKLDFPLAAPSANPFGYISPTSAQHVFDQLNGEISLILNGGDSDVGVESTIVQCKDDRVIVLRLGGLSLEDLQSVIGHVEVNAHSSSRPNAPGMLDSHYAPRKPFHVGDLANLESMNQGKNYGKLLFQGQPKNQKERVLSLSGDIHEAAKNLFKMMRELDQLDIEFILAEQAPNVGIGRAINDRLLRASSK
jgi:L-threonylcarbamoyladenylate synthase